MREQEKKERGRKSKRLATWRQTEKKWSQKQHPFTPLKQEKTGVPIVAQWVKKLT